MKRDDGSIFALAAVAAVAAAASVKKRRGAMNDDIEVLEQGAMVRHRAPRTAAMQARRRAELQLPDRQLARRIFGRSDVLGRMSFEEAVNNDPRRVDALISQRVGQAFMEADGRPSPGGDMESMLYTEGMRLARQAGDGDLSVKALVSLTEENMNRALFAQFPRLPGFVKARLRDNIEVFDRGFEEAAQIAERAAQAANDYEDALEWTSLADFLRDHPQQIRVALADALPGPVGRRMMPTPRRMLRGPRGGRNGSAYECIDCHDGVCHVHE
jgi:hypothetical protein